MLMMIFDGEMRCWRVVRVARSSFGRSLALAHQVARSAASFLHAVMADLPPPYTPQHPPAAFNYHQSGSGGGGGGGGVSIAPPTPYASSLAGGTRAPPPGTMPYVSMGTPSPTAAPPGSMPMAHMMATTSGGFAAPPPTSQDSLTRYLQHQQLLQQQQQHHQLLQQMQLSQAQASPMQPQLQQPYGSFSPASAAASTPLSVKQYSPAAYASVLAARPVYVTPGTPSGGGGGGGGASPLSVSGSFAPPSSSGSVGGMGGVRQTVPISGLQPRSLVQHGLAPAPATGGATIVQKQFSSSAASMSSSSSTSSSLPSSMIASPVASLSSAPSGTLYSTNIPSRPRTIAASSGVQPPPTAATTTAAAAAPPHSPNAATTATPHSTPSSAASAPSSSASHTRRPSLSLSNFLLERLPSWAGGSAASATNAPNAPGDGGSSNGAGGITSPRERAQRNSVSQPAIVPQVVSSKGALRNVEAACSDGTSRGFFAYELENNRMLKAIDKRIDELASLLDSAVAQQAILLVPQDVALATCIITDAFISTHLVVLKDPHDDGLDTAWAGSIPLSPPTSPRPLASSSSSSSLLLADVALPSSSTPTLAQLVAPNRRVFESLNGIIGRFARNHDTLTLIYNPYYVEPEPESGNDSEHNASASASPSAVAGDEHASGDPSALSQPTDSTVANNAQQKKIHILREGQVRLGNRPSICLLFISDYLWLSETDRKAPSDDTLVSSSNADEQDPEISV